MSDFEENNLENAIAIIGMAGRFPGARDMDEFWSNLSHGVVSVKFFSRDELIKMGIDKHLLDNPKFVAADAILDGMDQFDAAFFDYSAREAEIMDPQHRLFLESAWEVLESAGYCSELYDGRVAVYAGANLSGYMIRNLYSNPGLVESLGSFKIMIANGQDFLATKVSHKMNLRGPSVNVNTLCSSSMVAVHFACQNLLNYSCDIALAGGVSFQVSRNEAFFYQEGGIGSSDGHCRAFDSKANGTVSGSGLGVVALKRLEDAIADGDTIHAVIRGTAINNDGAIKNSYTAPSVEGQSQCIAEAIAMSGVNPETISYVETHGTGTNLGDPIEIAALTKAFSAYTQKKQFCAVGSVKTNIGHLVNAGGLASLVKTVLSMEHRVLPPSLNFEEPNPKIDFVNTPFYVNAKLSEWDSGDMPLRAGVSSFGIGGTNTHVILEEAPKREASEKSHRACQLVLLSAKTDTALETMSANLAAFLQKNPTLELADIAFTLALGRRNFSHRRALVCGSTEELISKLQTLQPEQVFTRFQKMKELPVVFLFPAEESGYAGMGRALYQTEEVYRDTVDECAKILEPQLGLDIRSAMFEAGAYREETVSRCALFVTEYAMAKLLTEWEITPELLFGEGVGEYAAACVGGVLTLEDALKLAVSPQNAQAVSFHAPQIPIVSGSAGKRLREDELTNPNHWAALKMDTQLTLDGLREILGDPNQILLEAGPGSRLCGKAQSLAGEKQEYFTVQAMPDADDKAGIPFLLASLAELWLFGGRVNWNRFYAGENRHRIPLPTYPFERQRYWIEPGVRGGGSGEQAVPTLKKRPRPAIETEYLEPASDSEKKIAEIAADILGYEKIGIDDDFFELGGHSLLAVAFIAKLRKAFQKDISLECLFENTTVAKLGVIFGEPPREEAGSQEDFEEGTL